MGFPEGEEVVVLGAVRTPIGRATRGSFKDTTPDTLLSAALTAAVERSGIRHDQVPDALPSPRQPLTSRNPPPTPPSHIPPLNPHLPIQGSLD